LDWNARDPRARPPFFGGLIDFRAVKEIYNVSQKPPKISSLKTFTPYPALQAGRLRSSRKLLSSVGAAYL